MSTATAEDVDLESLFAEDEAVPCDAILYAFDKSTGQAMPVEEPCQEPARWIGLKSCGHSKTACDGHAMLWALEKRKFQCVQCHQTITTKIIPL
jgi:hypothetical protein